MKYNEYQLEWYENDDLFNVCELLKGLWKKDIEKTISHFKWKYIDNPYMGRPLAFVVKKNDMIVGFRGCFITKWRVLKNKFFLLSGSDTIIHPEHRRKGLFSALVKYSLQEFDESDFKAYISLSANNKVINAKIKMGWKPLISRNYLRRIKIYNLLMILINKKLGIDLNRNNINFGKFNNIVVSKNCNYKKMMKLDYLINKNKNLIMLDKDEIFYTWRFGSKRRNYIFYYYYKDGELKAYTTILIEDYRTAKIIDYEYLDLEYIYSLLEYMIRKKHFNILSVLEMSLNNELIKTISKLKILDVDLYSPFEKVEKNIQITIRPIKKEYDEKDWYIHNYDIRNINNWAIKEICSDGV